VPYLIAISGTTIGTSLYLNNDGYGLVASAN